MIKCDLGQIMHVVSKDLLNSNGVLVKLVKQKLDAKNISVINDAIKSFVPFLTLQGIGFNLSHLKRKVFYFRIHIIFFVSLRYLGGTDNWREYSNQTSGYISLSKAKIYCYTQVNFKVNKSKKRIQTKKRLLQQLNDQLECT